jgi:23S rRNA (cytidine1920-2'-O)/16S rRNA (cytidine1409-2'-O)-methyltransferase
MKPKDRLDNLLIERALFTSREAARTAIMDGAIIVNGAKVTKAGAATATDAVIEIIKSYNLCPYVSRGGLKLEKAIKYFGVEPNGRIAVDGGASTGGFSDCLLQNGAARVYAIDVGHGQLDWKLRQDDRVRVLERVNLRNLKAQDLYIHGEEIADLAVMDVSFISVTKTLPALFDLLSPRAFEMIVLIKPQFEAGRHKVGKGGVVRDLATHIEVLDSVVAFIQSCDLKPRYVQLGLTFSPLKGPSGNIEYLLYLKGEDTLSIAENGVLKPLPFDAQILIEQVAKEAFDTLGAP